MPALPSDFQYDWTTAWNQWSRRQYQNGNLVHAVVNRHSGFGWEEVTLRVLFYGPPDTKRLPIAIHARYQGSDKEQVEAARTWCDWAVQAWRLHPYLAIQNAPRPTSLRTPDTLLLPAADGWTQEGMAWLRYDARPHDALVIIEEDGELETFGIGGIVRRFPITDFPSYSEALATAKIWAEWTMRRDAWVVAEGRITVRDWDRLNAGHEHETA